jgi:hypothetical protein
MVKPKSIDTIKLEDYFYLDEYQQLRWKQRYGKMRQGDLCGSKRGEVCFRGKYFPIGFITDLLKNISDIPPTDSGLPLARPAPSWMNFTRSETTTSLIIGEAARIGAEMRAATEAIRLKQSGYAAPPQYKRSTKE